MDIKEALNRIVGQLDLTTEEMQAVMRQIMTGQCTDAQVGAFLMGMRMKSETIDEIVGAVQVMRELAAPVRFDTDKLVDTCGTGGDGIISSTCPPLPRSLLRLLAARSLSTVTARYPARAVVPICSRRPGSFST